MLIEEAHWFAEKLAAYAQDGDGLSPLLNVGSSTLTFRSQQQPWIEQVIFQPLAQRGTTVLHLDLKAAEGVTLCGDLLDAPFRTEVAARGPRTALCSNLLEHVPDRQAMASAIISVLPPNALIFASCPYRYPYHPDPIDTRFRPTVAELADLFTGCELVEGEVVVGNTFWDQINRGPASLLKLGLRLLIPLYKPRSWLSIMAHLPWLTRPFEATCVVLRTPTRP